MSINWPWAILLCQFPDRPTLRPFLDYYQDLFTRNGTGGVCDYWRTVSFNSLDLTGSRVFGWFTMSHTSAELSQLNFPSQRSVPLQWGIDAARAGGVDLSGFRSILVVETAGTDHGAAGNGVLIIDQNPSLCEFGFICHEMGHGFGLPHSFSANPDAVYGDGWDLMSFATSTFQFPIEFRGARGDATVGINARNLQALNAVPPNRTWFPAAPDFSVALTLEPLNQPPIGNQGFLIAQILADSTRPLRVGSSFTIECRRKAGWDRSIPENAVLIHEVRADRNSYLQPGRGRRFLAGQQFETPDPKVFVRVVDIDGATGNARVHLWDVPEGSLRREVSRPEVYWMQSGKKRWVTEPRVLTGNLLKSWSDVRIVPDGGLASLPTGPDLLYLDPDRR